MLPYFAREFGFKVAGIDYAPAGCALAEESLRRSGVAGEIFCADIFDPPPSLLETYDVVVSFGVVEHFTDTTASIEAFARLLRPGGLLITSVPNMAGGTGFLQRVLDPAVYSRHVRLDAARLCTAHRNARLNVRDCRYLLAVNLGVVNINDVQRGTLEWLTKSMTLRGLQAITALVWMIETVIGPIPANRLTSPYVLCAAEKPRQALDRSA
jgi:2-polyprenyl-3-methyl-5-hydroxy-6-metoxy-1,4-benzoquinol methylase